MQKFEIFRAADAPEVNDSGLIDMIPGTDVQSEGLQRMFEAGLNDGSELRVLVNIPGFSLFHIWFKAGYPLLLHSHNVDCLYYIVAGSLTLGTETLGPRDCFFVPANAAYTYQVGPEGLELLEIRHENRADFRSHAKTDVSYNKAVEAILANREAWVDAKRPVLNG
jgi:hypothetical protein